MGGSPKRGGPNGGGGILSRGRVLIVAVLTLQLVLVVGFMKAPRLVWSSARDGVDNSAALDEASRGFWLWRMVSSTASNCTGGECTGRSSKRVEPRDEKAEIARSPALQTVNAATVFRNSHGMNAGLRERRARNGSNVVGDLRLSATRDSDDSRAARETKSGSWQLRREFAANTRSSLERDGLRSRVGYGDQWPRSNSSGDLLVRGVQNASASIASVRASTADVSIAPVARIGANTSIAIAAVATGNVSDSIIPVVRIRQSAFVFDDQRPGEEEEPEEEDELLEDADPDVAIARSAVGFGGRRGRLPPLKASMGSSNIELSSTNISSAELSSTRNNSLADELSSRNTSLADELSLRNISLAHELSSRNTSLADELSSRNTSLADELSSRNTSLADELSSRNTSLADELSSRNTSLADELSSRNISLVELSSSLKASTDGETRNATLEVSQYVPVSNASSEELEQVAGPMRTPSAVQNATLGNATDAIASSNANATCSQGLIYVYALPKRFNTELLENCSQLLAWGDRCQELSNAGLGPALATSPLPNLQENSSSGSWYGTDQFNGEVIFHTRMLAHPCRTHNPELAKAFYIPYYAGLDVARFLFNITDKNFTSVEKFTAVKRFTAVDRDKLGTELVAWLTRSPYWKRHQGLDHFLFLGRITWDFRRSGRRGWGSGLLHIPEMANMTKLTLERDTWDDSEMAVPYPTAFHPRNDSDVVAWQHALHTTTTRKRDLLFSFAGQKRHKIANDFRVALLEQCAQAASCAVLDCSLRKCEDDALATTKFFVRSTFCLQPRGDSFTRRSIFDALIAGCIPVFFWTKSAYLQYHWHLPADHRSYSVFIPKQDLLRGVRIEDVLSRIPPAKIQQMQEKVIEIIPRLVYAQGLVHFRDAFDTSVDMAMANFQLRLHRNATEQAAVVPAPPPMIPRPALTARAGAW